MEQPHKSGYVAVAGRPNVGKSSIMNAFLGQKLAAVSQRPQMTRRRQLGILTLPGAQVIFVDTPGIHKPVHKLGQFLVEEAFEALDDADVILMVVDATQAPNDEDRLVAAHLLEMKRLPPVILALNKADLLVAKGVYDAVAVSADGALLVPSKETAGTVYRVGETGCTCTAGTNGKPCWHALLAEAMILAREEVAAELDDEAYVLSLYTLDEGYFQP